MMHVMGRRSIGVLLAILAVGLFASGCDWSQFGFDAAHTGDNAYDTTVTPSNVSTLSLKFTDSFSRGVESQPAIVNGVMYVVSNSGYLDAYSANGTTDCSGTPSTCTPLWSAQVATPGASDPQTPAVVDGNVYVLSDSSEQVEGFDASGKTNCSGTPTVCTPVWHATVINGLGQSLAASNGLLYVTSIVQGGGSSKGDVLEAFDASGKTNCSGTPTVCTPVWSSTAFGAEYFLQDFSVSVANGIAYAIAGNAIYAFDANGATDCTGSPKVCSPMWEYTGLTTGASEYAVISGSTLFVDTFQITGVSPDLSYIGALDAFDANGATDCSGTPKVCTPLWQSSGNQFASQAAPTVANGLVFVPTEAGDIAAFDANGSTNCTGAPKACAPVWTTSVSGGQPVVGGNVLYATSGNNVEAFDTSGSAGCVSSVCSPLWSSSTPNTPSGELTIANGVLYISGSVPAGIQNGGVVEAYALPS